MDRQQWNAQFEAGLERLNTENLRLMHNFINKLAELERLSPTSEAHQRLKQEIQHLMESQRTNKQEITTIKRRRSAEE